MPYPPTHVLEPVAPLSGVPGGDHFDPRPVEVDLVHPAHHLLHEVPRRVEMPPLPHSHRRRLWLVNGRRPAVQYRLQIPVDPLVPRHRPAQMRTLRPTRTSLIITTIFINNTHTTNK